MYKEIDVYIHWYTNTLFRLGGGGGGSRPKLPKFRLINKVQRVYAKILFIYCHDGSVKISLYNASIEMDYKPKITWSHRPIDTFTIDLLVHIFWFIEKV